MARHCKRASRGLVDVKPRKQIICNPRFEHKIKLVRLKLNSDFQRFAVSNQLAKQKYRKRKKLSNQKKHKQTRRKIRKASREKRARKLERTPEYAEYGERNTKENKKRHR